MIKIVITNPAIREMKGVGKTSGKPYHLRMQTAYAYTTDREGVLAEIPDKFEIMLDSDQPPYGRGQFTLSPASCYVSRDGRLELSPRLVPVPAAK